jgi:signal recognition particle subunit SRP54
MVLDKLGESFRKGITRISNAITLDKKLVDGIIRDIQRSLIEADVNVELVFELSKDLKKIAYDENIKGIDKKEQLVKMIHDKIRGLIGEGKELPLGKREVVMFLGLYGSGKTTTISKLALYYSKRGRKVCALGLDTQRPAAMDQLEQMCEKAKVKCFIDKKEKDPLKIYANYEKDLKKYDLVFVDTAGRDGLNEELVKEIKKLEKKIKPNTRVLVMPADIGQTAKTQASEFQKALSIDGVVITRMDGSAKAGGALTACAETNAPVFFIGTGEKIHDIETFDADSFVSRLLGMGDLKSLIEKVKSATDEKQQKRIQDRLGSGKFTLMDVYTQLEQMNSMGGMDKIMSMVPGLGGMAGKISKADLEKQEKKMAHYKSAISSMTQEEIENPELMEKQTSRIQRVAKGSGTTTSEIRELIKQYKMLKEMLKLQNAGGLQDGKIDKKLMQKMARQFKGKMRF